ncbi:GNAT family N-acetyltransferase [Streptomyces sp. NBC_01465]|uniref:GNAT family N-acetyltransferase n=1 Tax=Streptomyces sp. NBC_01465 TaxID=2903878 RepID=UPI002E30D162|nr:GNAT family N-acetyltransferase [Streptomyces sp. NBC_01465]
MDTTPTESGGGLLARPLSPDDVPAWLDLRQAVERVDRTGHHVDADDLAEALADPKLDLRQDSLTLWDGPGMVAYALLHTPDGAVDAARFGGEGAVHPDWRRRGIGDRLVAWMAPRARTLHSERFASLPGELMITGKSDDKDLIALTEKQGFAPARWWFEMTHPLQRDRPSPGRVPEGLRLVALEPEYDEATRLAHNDAFRDHWNFCEMDEADWRTEVSGARSLRRPMSRLLLDGDIVAAYLIAEEYEADTAADGTRDCHIGYLATRRSHRGIGAAPALMAATLEAALADGYDTASLTVDTANPSGALGLYERLGFTTDSEFVTYARPITDA